MIRDRNTLVKGLNFLKDDFNEMALPSGQAAAEGLKVVDSPDANIPQSQRNPARKEVEALSLNDAGVSTGAQSLGTPGEKVAFRTPVGVPEPKELEEVGKGMSGIAKALNTPGVQRALAQAGIAFSRNNPNEVGTILGQGALSLVESRQIGELADALASGGEISDVDTTGLSSEGFARAEQLASSRRSSEQQERGLDIEQQRADLQGRVTDLQERGLELDEDRFDFSKITTKEELEIAKARIDVQERSAAIDEQIAPSRIALYKAQADALQREGTADDPQFQESMRLRRQQLLETLSDRLEQEKETLQSLKSPLNVETENTRGWPLRFMGEEKTTSDYQTLIEDQQEVVDKITGYIDEVQGLAIEGVGGTAEGGDDDDEVTIGTRDNPIEVATQEEIDNAESGQFLRLPNGELRRKQ